MTDARPTDPAQDDVLERNVEGLLRHAYRPELPDPEFARRVESRLLAERATAPATPLPQRLAAFAAAAALLIALFGLSHGEPPGAATPRPQTGETAERSPESNARDTTVALDAPAHDGQGITPLERGEAPAAKPLAVGGTLRLGARERRRVTLPDGSVLFANAGADVALTAPRTLDLRAGEVYLEVAHDAAHPFSVKTRDRAVHALGTRFSVTVDDRGTGVLVAEGRVRVDGIEHVLAAGSALRQGSDRVETAPRASYALSWTRDLMIAAESPLVPASEFSGGALVAIDPWGQEARLSLRKVHVDVHIEDGFARTTLDETYFNNAAWRMEGTFYFPLPADASLSRLAMYVNGKLMEGGMAERTRARDVYEQIVTRRKDPALLEWIDGSTFKMRVFPLEAREEKRIVISYTQRLAPEYGAMTYRLPAGHNLESTGDWSFSARVAHAGQRVSEGWSSPSHELAAASEGDDLVLSAHSGATLLRHDLVLRLDAADAAPDSLRCSTFTQDGQRYLLTRYRPDLPASAAPTRRDWIFLFERSGDRDPLVARMQVDVMRALLEQAEDGDTFAIVLANTHAHRLTPERLPVTRAAVDAALARLERTHLIGALDLGVALDDVNDFAQHVERPFVVHLGSGVATIGERDPGALAKRAPADAPYVGVAVGRRWSRGFMRAAAARTGGHVTHIDPDESPRWRAFELLSTLNTPRLLGVKVVDAAERTDFLAFDDAVAHGQEVAAITRVAKDAPLLTEIVVSGTVGGAPFTRTLAVTDPRGGAGYLPRQWAKLEIDRLLADDAAAHKDEIVALSKAMYVMSPFTSLLVLETPEMYKQFGVDTGRKDHWALYPCPETIDVVRDADSKVVTATEPESARSSVRDVLATIVVRDRRELLSWPGMQRGYWGAQTLPQWETLRAQQGPGGYIDIDSEVIGIGGGGGGGGSFRNSGEWSAMLSGANVANALEGLRTNVSREAGRVRFGGWRQLAFGPASLQASQLRLGLRDDFEATIALDGLRYETFSLLPSSGPFPGFYRGPSGEVPPDTRFPSDQPFVLDMSSPMSGLPMSQLVAWNGRRSRPREASTRMAGAFARYGLDARMVQNPYYLQQLLQYQRPYPQNDAYYFSDLLAFAPGMNTTRDDVASVLEVEAQRSPEDRPGRVDAGSRTLIERARSHGWRTVRVHGGDGDAIRYDGSGRYAWDRVLPNGLREVVVFDGESLRHLYPEIGVGATRPASFAHRAALLRAVPFALPSVEDLARGADLVSVDARTLDRVAQGGSGLRERFVFGDDGALRSRTILDGEQVRVRFAFDAGRWTVTGAEGDEIASATFDVDDVEAPDLTPDTSSLVMLPLPYRTLDHVVKTYGIGDESKFADWSEEAASARMAAALCQNGWSLMQTVGTRYLAKGDRRLGFYTLLLASGQTFDRTTSTSLNGGVTVTFDPLRSGRDTQLGEYLARQMHRTTKDWQAEIGRLPGDRDTFLAEMAELATLNVRWSSGKANQGDEAARSAEAERAYRFAEVAHDRLGAFSVLTLLWNYGVADQETNRGRTLALLERFRDEPALDYVARYETARMRQSAGENERAAALFRDLYTQTLAKGVVPPIDYTVMQALGQNDDGSGRTGFTRFMYERASGEIAAGRRVNAVWMALQAYFSGNQQLGEELFSLATADIDRESRPAVTVAGVQYMRLTGRNEAALRYLRAFLEDPRAAEQSGYWRLYAAIAQQQGSSAESLTGLEHAIDLDYADLEGVVNLAAVRNDHGMLFMEYTRVADAARALGVPSPDGFTGRVIRAADRWRSLDIDDSAACRAAATVLERLGETRLAWDYLTTPLAEHPNEAAPWSGVAAQLAQQGDLEFAARCYETAFSIEESNAQILWDLAHVRQQQGEKEAAHAALRRIAEGDWQPRFQWIKQQAAQMLPK